MREREATLQAVVKASPDIISILPDDLEPFVAAQRRVLGGQRESAAVRLRVRHADGHWVTLEAHSRPLAALGGLLVVSRDVTEQAAFDEQLRLAKLAAEQANSASSTRSSTSPPSRRGGCRCRWSRWPWPTSPPRR